MPDEELLEHGKDAYDWIVPSSEWNTLYTDNNYILDSFNIVKGERVFDHLEKFVNAQFEQHITEYCMYS